MLCTACALMLWASVVTGVTVDMEGPGCLEYEPLIVHDYVSYDVHAYPTQNQIQTTSSCTVKFRPADPDRRFRIYVKELVLGDCGILIKVFDGDIYLKTETWLLNCNFRAGKRLDTYSKDLAIRLEKQTSDSTNVYRFQFIVTTDIGPYLDGFHTPEEVVSNNELSTGALAGIIVAIGLVVIIVVLLIIFYIIRWRRNKKQRAQSLTTIYTSSASQSTQSRSKQSNEPAKKMSVKKCAYINSTWSTRDVPGKTSTAVSPPDEDDVFVSAPKKKDADLENSSGKEEKVMKVRYSDQNGVNVSNSSSNKARETAKSQGGGIYEKKGSVRSQRSVGKSAGRSSVLSDRDRQKRDEPDTGRHGRSDSQDRDRRSRSDKYAYDNKTFEDERLYDLHRKSRSGSSRSRTKSPSRGGSRDGSSTTDQDRGQPRHHSGSRRSRSSDANHGGQSDHHHHHHSTSGTRSSQSGHSSHGRSRSPSSRNGHSRNGHARSRSPGSGSRHSSVRRSKGRSAADR